MTAPGGSAPALELEHISVRFKTAEGSVSAVNDVTFRVQQGTIFGLVGESGCGKSTLALTTMGLLPAAATVTGSVRLDGRELTSLEAEQWRELRGNRVSFIPQDARSALDPVMSVGDQVAEAVQAHQRVGRPEARRVATEALTSTGIVNAAARYKDPPHRFSGGMCQRVVIATALVNGPSLLVADEATTALDVTVQAQILSLLKREQDRRNMTVLLITHDMGVVAEMCDRVGVMYAGELVELGDVEDIFSRPRHPYTRALLAAIPTSRRADGPLKVIPGQVPHLLGAVTGCRFKDRCDYRGPECEERPELLAVDPVHSVACFNQADIMAGERVAVLADNQNG